MPVGGENHAAEETQSKIFGSSHFIEHMLDIDSAGAQMFWFKKVLHYDCYDALWLDENFKYALVEHILDIESASTYTRSI